MNDIENFYQQQAQSTLSAVPWVARIQEKALADFMHMGFPQRKDEDWKYSQVTPFLNQRFFLKEVSQTSSCITEPVAMGRCLSIYNGAIVETDPLVAELSKQIVIKPLREALQSHGDILQNYFDQSLQHQHGFQALNTAVLQTGWFIYIPKNVQLTTPLWLSHWQDEKEQAVYVRHMIVAEPGSAVTVIEDYHGLADCHYFTNTLTEIHAGQGASVKHYKIQRESGQACHIGHIAASQAAFSQVESHSFSIGGKFVRSDVHIKLNESHAKSFLNGIYVPGQGQHIDHHTRVDHNVPDCQSDQDYKGILAANTRAVFNGKIVVAKDAQHTKATQQNKNLLLAKNAEIDTQPQLEIYADDVVCTHGAAVGQLNEDALFYLATRGIEHQQASQYLIAAFLQENLQAIPHELLANWIRQLLNTQLGQNNG